MFRPQGSAAHPPTLAGCLAATALRTSALPPQIPAAPSPSPATPRSALNSPSAPQPPLRFTFHQNQQYPVGIGFSDRCPCIIFLINIFYSDALLKWHRHPPCRTLPVPCSAGRSKSLAASSSSPPLSRWAPPRPPELITPPGPFGKNTQAIEGLVGNNNNKNENKNLISGFGRE